MSNNTDFPITLSPSLMLGNITKPSEESILPNGTWYQSSDAGDGFVCEFKPGTLDTYSHITFDMLLDGDIATVFALRLQEGTDGPEFLCHFSCLNQCQARVRLPLSATLQNTWLFGREGAWLKIICSGDSVDLAKVDRLSFTVFRKIDTPAKWCMTSIQAVDTEPEKLTNPLLPKGPLLDQFGQSTLNHWPGKCHDESELITRLQNQLDEASNQQWPESFSGHGGCKDMQFNATGFFHTHHDGKRWWLVDPKGHPFWSAGLDCVRSYIDTNIEGLESALQWSPCSDAEYSDACSEKNGVKCANFLRANLIRAFGDKWETNWATLAISQLRKFGFNTVANWSQWEIAREHGFPYVRPLQWPAADGPQAKRIFRDMPDVFDPVFAEEAAFYAKQLKQTADDPAFIGYFLMNEPTWGFASMTPAQGMLYNCDGGSTREALENFLRKKYKDNTALSKVWGEDVSFDKISRGRWKHRVTEGAKADLEAFSSIMVEKLFNMLSSECRKVDPNHLNLGARYYHLPPKWAIKAMGCFDVFSVNGYREKVDRELEMACQQLDCPALIGEWHFGALDAGLPASGIGHVQTQTDRGRAYRVYTEDAAAQPWCVGVHYFTLYDQSAMGRFDGENYNIGFLDICHRSYPIANAARKSHQRLYDIATGSAQPFNDAPEYLERLFY